MLRIKDRAEREFCYAPTAEEVLCDIMRREIKSYRQLPVNFYQIQTKFRDEVRPRFGVMRAGEFNMKDAYSFHVDADSLTDGYLARHEERVVSLTPHGLQPRPARAHTSAIARP